MPVKWLTHIFTHSQTHSLCVPAQGQESKSERNNEGGTKSTNFRGADGRTGAVTTLHRDCIINRHHCFSQPAGLGQVGSKSLLSINVPNAIHLTLTISCLKQISKPGSFQPLLHNLPAWLTLQTFPQSHTVHTSGGSLSLCYRPSRQSTNPIRAAVCLGMCCSCGHMAPSHYKLHLF